MSHDLADHKNNRNDDDLILQLSALEFERDSKQRRCSEIFDRIQQCRRELESLNSELNDLHMILEPLDDQIQFISDQIRGTGVSSQYMTQIQTQNVAADDDFDVDDDVVVVDNKNDQQTGNSLDFIDDEVLETQEVVRASANIQLGGGGGGRIGNNIMLSTSSTSTSQANATNSGVTKPTLKIVNGTNNSNSKHPSVNSATIEQSNDTKATGSKGTLDSFIVSSNNRSSTVDPYETVMSIGTAIATTTSAIPKQPQSETPIRQKIEFQNNTYATANRPASEGRNTSYIHYLSSDNFSWSEKLLHLLRNVFKIKSFRENQKEVINCTMSGDDAFVIMRTGGGKSLTYQLPALLERETNPSKVTLVVSPLLSLIEDQVDQMNEFVHGSATSFVSGLGAQEHALRWAKIRDSQSGCVLIFVTPEKIVKSNKLRNELEKLNDQKRLGRFVIDEAHCATQWGHDFRPDYAKLGLLKYHFPNVPLIAVTATASNRVRDEVCRILKIGKNYQFFRSTANRPNLRYSVRQKHDNKDKVVDDIAMFINEKHSNEAGIIYTFSRKDADTVAESLSKHGIVAASYHSDVDPSRKSAIHKAWMRDQCQVVVATIAFGLGINKPDVRFVIHHSVSKSLEGYYQESGRAGRDGGPGECVLYFSPKDVPRMICMIHGDNGEPAFWNMVRYGLAIGDDSLYRSLLLQCLGEENYEGSFVTNGFNRDVTKHAITVTELVLYIQNDGNDVTLAQLVTQWRAKKDVAPCVNRNPPGNDLNKEECERVILHLLLFEILHPKVVWNAYSSTMYIIPGPRAQDFVISTRANVQIEFPHRNLSRKSTVSSTKTSDEDGWIKARSGKTSSTKRKSNSTKQSNHKISNANNSNQGSRFVTAVAKKSRTKSMEPKNHSIDVIELSDDSEDETKKSKDIFESSTSEEEFIGDLK